MAEIHDDKVALSMLKRRVATLEAERDALCAEVEEMREALAFYADTSKYPAPLTGGMGALWADCGEIAKAALAKSTGANDG